MDRLKPLLLSLNVWDFLISHEQLCRCGHSLPMKAIWKHITVLLVSTLRISIGGQCHRILLHLWFSLVRPTSDETFRSLLVRLLDVSSSSYSASVSCKEKPAQCPPKCMFKMRSSSAFSDKQLKYCNLRICLQKWWDAFLDMDKQKSPNPLLTEKNAWLAERGCIVVKWLGGRKHGFSVILVWFVVGGILEWRWMNQWRIGEEAPFWRGDSLNGSLNHQLYL